MGKKGFLLPLLSVLVLASLISLPAARAQLSVMSMEISTAEDVMKLIIVFIFGSDFPDEWLTYSGFMQYIIFPFIAVFVVMYGILSELRIFHNANVKAVLSLVMAFVGGRWLLQTMRGFLVVNAFWGTVLWGALMFFGIVAWAVARGMEYYGWGRQSYKNLRNEAVREAKIGENINELTNRVLQDKIILTAAIAANKPKAAIQSLENVLTSDMDRLDRERERLESKAK